MRAMTARDDTNPHSPAPRLGTLAFLLGALVLTAVGLVVELVGATDYPIAFKILTLFGWVVCGAIATAAFFSVVRQQTRGNQAGIQSQLAFALIAVVALTTTTTLILLSSFNSLGGGEVTGIARESLLGVVALGVLAALGAATLRLAIGWLFVLLIPATGIWLLGVAFLPEDPDRSWAMEFLRLGGAAVPALVVAVIRFWFDRTARERTMLEAKVNAFGNELDRARSVHDAMFPDPLSGEIIFEYTYDPLLGIGGDFLHTHVHEPSGRVTLTLLDVSGHGLAAALTVNRLFGELERICAEHPDEVTPALLMGGLNRYVHLVMAKHSLYATAACVLIDPKLCELQWAVAGHPPPLLRRKGGTVEDLECTSLILGAVGPAEFDPAQQSIAIGIGDTVVLYTDGTFESRNDQGEFFGLDRLRTTLAFDTPPREWSTFIAHAVEQFRGRHRGRSQLIEDDLLVASLSLGARRRVIEVTPSSQVAPPPRAQADVHATREAPSPTGDQAPR